MLKYLEYRHDKASRFWEVSVADTLLTRRWGTIGSKGQFNEKLFATNKEALLEAEKLSTQKILKGYSAPDLESQLLGVLRKDMPEAFKKLKSICAKIDTKLEQFGGKKLKSIDYSGYKRLADTLSYSRWGWVPGGKTVSFLETDRFGQHVFGNMYTSDEYPWPTDNEIPYLPIIQLDLDVISNHIGVNIGEGFIQLFDGMHIPDLDGDYYFLRQIPRDKISPKLLTDFPSYTTAEIKLINKKNLIYRDFESNFKDDAIHIEQFGEKIFVFPKVAELLYDDIEMLRFDIESADKALYQKVNKYLDSFDNAWHQVQDYDKHIERYQYSASFFGLYEPIQSELVDLSPRITLYKLKGYREIIEGWTDDSRTDILADGSGAILMEYNTGNGRWDFSFHGQR